LAYAIIAGSLNLLGNHTLMSINGVSTIGEITNTQLVPEDEFQYSSTFNAPSNASIVWFVTVEGDKTTFTTKFSSSFKLSKIAEKVTIVYWPSSPQNAKILSFMSLYLGSLLAIFMGFFFVDRNVYISRRQTQ
jgi:hypothetical protein